MFFGIRWGFEQKEVHGFLDDRPLAPETERRAAERRDHFQAVQIRLFLDLADRRLEQRLLPFLVAFGERPTVERVLDEEQLNPARLTAIDDPTRRRLMPEGWGRFSNLTVRIASTKPTPPPSAIFR